VSQRRRTAVYSLLLAGSLRRCLLEHHDGLIAFVFCLLYQTTLRHLSEDTTLHNYGRDNLKSKIIIKDILKASLLINLCKQYLENELLPHRKDTVSFTKIIRLMLFR
jgi:hypothetical protein